MTDKRPWLALYKSKDWKRLRAWQLSQEPMCRFCLEVGDVTAATVADHVKNHKGDLSLFFDAANLQSLCASCHSGIKQSVDRGRVVVRYGEDGYPTT